MAPEFDPNRYRERLLAMQNALDAAVRDPPQLERRTEFPEPTRGGVDRGDESFSALWTELTLASAERRDAALHAIRRALTRLDDGTFGYCVDCGSKIDPARLDANPMASRCVPCQARFENDRNERDATPSL